MPRTSSGPPGRSWRRRATRCAAERWLTEPPPWPPASVDKLLKRGEEGAALLETLTAEIAPEADVRNWLLRSWLAPRRRVDGRLLAELAGALDGRLVREPGSGPGSAASGPPGPASATAGWRDGRRSRTMIRVTLEGLVKRYDRIAVVDGASLEIRPGELTYVLGPSGAGKTTLARLVAGLEPLDDGEIFFDGRVIHTLPAAGRGGSGSCSRTTPSGRG